MYPFLRMAYQFARVRRMPPLGLLGTHVSHHIVWPIDLDMFAELNNGRTLTLYDLARVPMSARTGLLAARRNGGFGLTVAGVSVRYRRRLTAFARVEIRTSTLGWDQRFIYVNQSIWTADGDCANNALIRIAVLRNRRLVDPAELLGRIEPGTVSPPLPDWVQRWVEADAARPWPPAHPAHD